MKTHHPRAVVLLSGGLDSAVTAAIASRDLRLDVHPLTFDYGQRHGIEMHSAEKIADSLGINRPMTATLRLPGWSSALTDESMVPSAGQDPMRDGIPKTFVPGRNAVFLSVAFGFAASIRATHVFTGVNAVDFSGYPDCRPAFIDRMQRALDAALDGSEFPEIALHAPLIHLSKMAIIERGLALGVDFSLTHSCYDPIASFACGECDSCQIRMRAFHALGLADPIRYAPPELLAARKSARS